MMKDDLLKRMLSRSKSKDDNHLDSPAEVTNRRKIMKVAHQRSNSDPLSPNVLNNLWKRSLSNHAVTATATDAMPVGNGTLPRTFTRTTSKGRKQILEEILASKVRSDSQVGLPAHCVRIFLINPSCRTHSWMRRRTYRPAADRRSTKATAPPTPRRHIATTSKELRQAAAVCMRICFDSAESSHR